jgi:hypothetical protein
MTQDERWNIRYQEVKSFIETNKRNPSKYRIEEHDMLNWVKANRKVMNVGKMKEVQPVFFLKKSWRYYDSSRKIRIFASLLK